MPCSRGRKRRHVGSRSSRASCETPEARRDRRGPARHTLRGGLRPVAHLVTGGLGLRIDLTYDRLADLQIAIDALLSLRDDGDDIVVELGVGEGELRVAVGPLPAEALRDLDEDDAALGLRRVLETVCDGFERDERHDGAWVELTKRAVA